MESLQNGKKKKATYTENQKESIEISMTYADQIWLRDVDTHRTYKRNRMKLQ